MNLKFWGWPTKRRHRLETERLAERVYAVSVLSQALRETTVDVKANHHVTYAPRPPAPIPVAINIVFVFQDGREYREFVTLNGLSVYDMNFPHYVAAEITAGRPIHSMRVEMRYKSGGMLL